MLEMHVCYVQARITTHQPKTVRQMPALPTEPVFHPARRHAPVNLPAARAVKLSEPAPVPGAVNGVHAITHPMCATVIPDITPAAPAQPVPANRTAARPRHVPHWGQNGPAHIMNVPGTKAASVTNHVRLTVPVMQHHLARQMPHAPITHHIHMTARNITVVHVAPRLEHARSMDLIVILVIRRMAIPAKRKYIQ